MTNRYFDLYEMYRENLVSLNNPEEYITKFDKNSDENLNIGGDVNFFVGLIQKKWFIGDLPVSVSNDTKLMRINHKRTNREYFYMSYLEENVNFSKAPTKSNYELNGTKSFFVNFLGNTDEKNRVELFIIYYKDNKKVSLDTVLLNSSQVIETKNNYDSVRFAIRIAGKGITKIKLIQFYNTEDNTEKKGYISESKALKDIDISEYSWKSFKEIKDFNPKEWFIKDKKNIKNISFGNSLVFDADFGKGDFKYLSYAEQNVDFSRTPQSNGFDISPNYNFEVEFNGKKQDTLRVELFIIFYSKGKKEQIETLLLNEKRNIKLKPSVDKYRVAIKFSGVGYANINDIVIRQKKEIEFLPISILRKIGFDNPKTINDSKIAVIADDFTLSCLSPEAHLFTFGPDDWKAILEINKPHLLFVESAWHGNGGRWTRKVSHINNTNTLQLIELVKWCKENRIPTVFWNKEDPVHFNSFIETAKNFDYIFTTDQNSVEMYKNIVDHNNVYPLPFAAQPKIHNPIKEYERLNRSSFAGSYYANKYLERQKDMNMLLESAAYHGLDIFDRNYGKGLVEFYFPKNLRPHVVGSLKPSEISKAYKGYKIALNVNSVVDSPTMFSRRVFECLASNTPVVSTFSKGIENLLGDSVFMAKDKEGFNKIFEKLLKDNDYYKQYAHLGYRKVMQSHTYSERLKFIFGLTAINIVEESPIVGVLSIVSSEEELERITKMYIKQNYLNKKLFVIAPKTIKQVLKTHDLYNDIVIYSANEFINGFQIGGFSFLSLFNPLNEYGENYLADLLMATKYSNSQIIGKKAFYTVNDSKEITLNNKEDEHCYVDELFFDRSIISNEVYNKISVDDIYDIAKYNINLSIFFKKGYQLYSADAFNFIKNGNESIHESNYEKVMI